MTDAVKYQDEALKRFIPFLNQQVGNGNWAMVITADHAAMPNPIDSGRVRDLDRRRLAGDRDEVRHERRLDADRRQRATGLDLPERERGRANNTTIDDIARYTQTLTQAETSGGGVTPNPGQENDPVFQAVFPSSILPNLPCLPEVKTTPRTSSSDVHGSARSVSYPSVVLGPVVVRFRQNGAPPWPPMRW